VNKRADDKAAADTRRGHREVRRDKTERLKSKVHGSAVDAATAAGQATKRFGKAAKEAVGEKYMDKRKENLEVKDILDTEKRRKSGIAQGDKEKADQREKEAQRDARAKGRDEGDPYRKEHETKKDIPRVGQIGRGSAEREEIKGQEAEHQASRSASNASLRAQQDADKASRWAAPDSGGSPQAGEGAEASHAASEQEKRKEDAGIIDKTAEASRKAVGQQPPERATSQTRGPAARRPGERAVGGRVTSTSDPVPGNEPGSLRADPSNNAALSRQRAADRTKRQGKALKSLAAFQKTPDKPATQKTISGSRGQEHWQRERGRERKRGEVSLVSRAPKRTKNFPPGDPRFTGPRKESQHQLGASTEYHRIGSLIAEILQ